MPEGAGLEFLALLLAAAAVASGVYAAAFPYFSGERQREKRVSSIGESRRGGPAAPAAEAVAASRRKAVADTLKDLESRQRAKEKVTLRLRLQRAGLEITPKAFWIASVVCGLTLGVATFVSLPPTVLSQVAAFAAVFVGTFGLPRWVVGKMVKRRQNKFLAELANAIDVVVRGVKSGLPLNECLQIIARESPEPIASEFREVIEQQRVGVPLGEALEKLSLRMPLPEVKFLAIVISIQQQAGGNLSEALGNLSGVLRDRHRLQMKVKALSAEAKASAIVLASLPPLVMFMVYGTSPDYIQPLFATKSGNFFLLLSGCWMLIGVLVMRKMINFKY